MRNTVTGVGVAVGVAEIVAVAVGVAVLVGVGVTPPTIVWTVCAVLLFSFDSKTLFSGSITTLVPVLVIIPAASGLITTVSVAVSAPLSEFRHPPVNVTPLRSVTALYPWSPPALSNMNGTPFGKSNLTFGQADPPSADGELVASKV